MRLHRLALQISLLLQPRAFLKCFCILFCASVLSGIWSWRFRITLLFPVLCMLSPLHPPLGLQTSRCVAVAVLHAEMVPTWGLSKVFVASASVGPLAI